MIILSNLSLEDEKQNNFLPTCLQGNSCREFSNTSHGVFGAETVKDFKSESE